MTKATKGNTVKIHYKGSLTDGTVFDSSEGREPLEFKIGSGQVIPGFEEAVNGMELGEKKKVNIPADKAYGPRNEQLVISIPKTQVPEDLKPEVNQRLQMGGPGGQVVYVTVTEITDQEITVDANPPLAGEDLDFDIELVAIA
jgi:peptidylprolyl isomerase